MFIVIKACCNRTCETRYYRDYKSFNQETFLSDLRNTDWSEKLRNLHNNIHQATESIISYIEGISQKHAPIRKASQSKSKQLNKPWITNSYQTNVDHITICKGL